MRRLFSRQFYISKISRAGVAADDHLQFVDNHLDIRTAWSVGPARWIVYLGLLLLVAIATATWITHSNSRARILADAQRNLQNLASVLAENVGRAFQALDLVETSLMQQLQSRRIASSGDFERATSGNEVHLMLEEQISGLVHVSSLSLIDARGRLVNTSRAWPPPAADVSGLDYFKIIESSREVTHVVGEPVRDRATETWTINIANKITGPDGQFLGLVVGTIETYYFEQYYRAIAFGNGSSVALLYRDGALLARYPAIAQKDNIENTQIGALNNSLSMDRAVSGRLVGEFDGGERLVAVQPLTGYPFAVAITAATDAILAEWRNDTVFVFGAAFFLIVVVASMILLCARIVGNHFIQQKYRLHTAIDNMNHGLCLFDRRGRLVVHNRRYLEMFGLPPDLIKPGCSLRELVRHLEDAKIVGGGQDKKIAEFLALIAEGKTTQSTRELKDGRTILVTNRPLADGGWVATHEDITAQRQYESSLTDALVAAKQATLNLNVAIGNMSHGLSMFDSEERIVVVNAQYIQMYGLSPEIVKPGCKLIELFQHRAAIGQLTIAPELYRAEFMSRLAEGKILNRLVRTANGREISIVTRPMPGGGWVALHEDITERKLAERNLEQTQRFLNTIIENTPAPIVVKDPATQQFVLVNRAYEQLMGRSREDLIGKTVRDLFPTQQATFIIEQDEYAIQSGSQIFKHEFSLETPGNGNRTVATTRLVVRDNDHNPEHLIAVIEDVTDRKRSEAQIAHMAHHDALTDLPNRVLLQERLKEALLRVPRGESLAVFYLDLDRFKTINDTLGHSIGDELLKAVADRLRGCARETDTVARLGGDEFAIIQTAIEQPSDAATFARRIRDAITEPYQLEGHLIIADVSIGISIAPGDATELEQLLKNADMALYGAKADGRGNFRFFEREMDERLKARRILELELRNALAIGEFELYYQPILSLEREEVTGCEALLRWRHPDRGLIPPAEFIPIAEESGLIIPLGDWVLKTACAEAATWPDGISVAVNVSPVQIKEQTLGLAVISALAASGLPARRLEIEITEAVLLQDNQATLSTLHQLHALGVRIAMDDFGTGYSSLKYLRSFPFDKIKIDRLFINDLSSKDDVVAIVGAIVSLARSLKMTTTAEGIETQVQLDRVRALGCTEMQGYLFSHPVSAQEISRFFSQHARGVHGAVSAA
jgi:diguanylate cyclase (GGDEF)-like protein/PAS domain S-box-containing protein